MDFDYFMQQALNEAKLAYNENETPIGSVIVYENNIIGRGHNLRHTLKSPTAHAEIFAINEAAKFIGDWRLSGCSIFVTIEPCPMCAGAIVSSRIDLLVFGAKNKKAGCAGSILNILNEPKFNHQVYVVDSIMEKECSELMSSFFKKIR